MCWNFVSTLLEGRLQKEFFQSWLASRKSTTRARSGFDPSRPTKFVVHDIEKSLVGEILISYHSIYTILQSFIRVVSTLLNKLVQMDLIDADSIVAIWTSVETWLLTSGHPASYAEAWWVLLKKKRGKGMSDVKIYCKHIVLVVVLYRSSYRDLTYFAILINSIV